MTRPKFLSIIFLLVISFIFLKIYQHNLLIKLSYEKQRFALKKEELKQKKNLLLVDFYKLKDFKRIKNIASQELGLQELTLSQIKTFTSVY
ncbi:hypothetical protein KJ644_03340 [Candidatus Dependentiae bacterium]|nr:hypothetical protein [Candidatus Dependentiae bacterium]MBU4387480.1 hypothetical protein [Candidatus Dependentiae bacterium]MCG2756493.1 hypothetical protein [Candidatus Dependentiae bacterium]